MHESQNSRHVRRVVGLWRYPVKSMGAEALAEVDVSWHGLAGDRRWAFIRNGVAHSGFPWLTLRERDDMNLYHPSFLEPARADSHRRSCALRPGSSSMLRTRRSGQSSARTDCK